MNKYYFILFLLFCFACKQTETDELIDFQTFNIPLINSSIKLPNHLELKNEYYGSKHDILYGCSFLPKEIEISVDSILKSMKFEFEIINISHSPILNSDTIPKFEIWRHILLRYQVDSAKHYPFNYRVINKNFDQKKLNLYYEFLNYYGDTNILYYFQGIKVLNSSIIKLHIATHSYTDSTRNLYRKIFESIK